MQLNPREYFTIVRQIDDPYDTTTYYVRAVIRNARTDDIIDTVDLSDQGNGRFSKPWQVPADTSGQGFYIIITTTVYEDSGYSTASRRYAVEQNEHLVHRRRQAVGGGAVDYRIIGQVVNEILDQRGVKKEAIDKEDIKSLVVDELKKVKSDLKKSIGGITIPEEKELDLTPLVSLLQETRDELSRKVDEKPVTEKTNIKPILDNMDQLGRSIEQSNETIQKVKDLKTVLEEVPKILNLVQQVEEVMKDVLFVANRNKRKEGNKKTGPVPSFARGLIDV